MSAALADTTDSDLEGDRKTRNNNHSRSIIRHHETVPHLLHWPLSLDRISMLLLEEPMTNGRNNSSGRTSTNSKCRRAVSLPGLSRPEQQQQPRTSHHRRRHHHHQSCGAAVLVSSSSTYSTARRTMLMPLLLVGIAVVIGTCTPAGAASASTTTTPTRPRGIIVIQGDDLHFDEWWTPTAHFPNADDEDGSSMPRHVNMPHLDRLRRGGLQMTRAYSASPWCGTSRYTTLTGRYASRSAASRYYNAGRDVSYVKIPTTKLVDIYNSNVGDDTYTFLGDGRDCSTNNLAQTLRDAKYRTGVIGKWHLDYDSFNGRVDYDYSATQEHIRSCGFATAEAIYHENLNGDWTENGRFTHNMEHLTIRAIEFIDESMQANQDFFMYFNPTAPHESGNVHEALTEYDCRDTVEGRLDDEPFIPGMTNVEGGCTAYRQTILERAGGDTSNAVLGAIWVDDAVGALLLHLETLNLFDDTLIVFQMDHGKEGKGSLYEPGVRIAQFVHYPTAIAPGTTYAGLVSTIDVAPTLLDYAGVAPAYEMDGISWRERPAELTDRCLVTEDDYDRAIICHCAKYLEIGKVGDSNTYRRGQREGLVHDDVSPFDLCKDDGNGNRHYVTSPNTSRETKAVEVVDDLVAMLECHYTMTDPNVPPRYGICDSLLFRQGFPSVLSSTSSSGGGDGGGQLPVAPPNNNKVAADTEDDESTHQYPPIESGNGGDETDDEILLSFSTSEQAKEAEAFATSSAPRTTTTTTAGLAVYGASSWLAAFVVSSYWLRC